jgi:hypothetical protein
MGRNPTNTSGFSSLNPTYTKMAKVLLNQNIVLIIGE